MYRSLAPLIVDGDQWQQVIVTGKHWYEVLDQWCGSRGSLNVEQPHSGS